MAVNSSPASPAAVFVGPADCMAALPRRSTSFALQG